MISSADRSLREENAKFLSRRWNYVRAHGSGARLSIDNETATILSHLTLDEVKRAADASAPLFGLAVDEQALRNLMDAPPMAANCDEADGLVRDENEDILINRWAAVRQDDVSARTLFGVSPRVADFLRQATLDDIRRIASAGHPCARTLVRPAYFYQAGRSLHLVLSQRTCLATAAVRSGR